MKENDNTTSNIFLISTEDNRIVTVTEESRGDRYSPVWSPTGDWIAFMAQIAGTKDIYLIRPDGSGLINVTQSMEDEHAPAWRVFAP
jgi:Tol biopolymer transport system component